MEKKERRKKYKDDAVILALLLAVPKNLPITDLEKKIGSRMRSQQNWSNRLKYLVQNKLISCESEKNRVQRGNKRNLYSISKENLPALFDAYWRQWGKLDKIFPLNVLLLGRKPGIFLDAKVMKRIKAVVSSDFNYYFIGERNNSDKSNFNVRDENAWIAVVMLLSAAFFMELPYTISAVVKSGYKPSSPALYAIFEKTAKAHPTEYAEFNELMHNPS